MLRKGGPLVAPTGSSLRPTTAQAHQEASTRDRPTPPSSTDGSSQPWSTTAATDDQQMHAYMDAAPTRSEDAVSSMGPTGEPTVIQLDDVAVATATDDDGVAMMTGDASSRGDGTNIRARAAGGRAGGQPPQKIHLTPPSTRRASPGGRTSKPDAEDDFDPIEEFLEILPPPLARLLVHAGKKLNPSGIELIGLKKELREDPKGTEATYNTDKTKQLVTALTVGLKPYGVALPVALGVWILVQLISPSFFLYPYFYFDFVGIFSSWMLLLWGGILSGAVWYFRGRDVRCYGRPYLLKAANSLITALVEEFGFRFLFICFAMVAMQMFNVLIEHIGLYLGALMVVAGLAISFTTVLYMMEILNNNEHVKRLMKRYNPIHVLVGSGMLAAAGLLILVLGLVWGALFAVLWDWVVFPVVNFVTLFQYDHFFMGAFGMNANSYDGAWIGARTRRRIWQQNATDSRMFMVGILLSNLFYRDGKKFQGVLGWINSLFVGLALANAMVTHGLFTALAVHLLYDAQYFLAGYIVNKYCKKRRPTLDEM